jgi:hypothetical protein
LDDQINCNSINNKNLRFYQNEPKTINGLVQTILQHFSPRCATANLIIIENTANEPINDSESKELLQLELKPRNCLDIEVKSVESKASGIEHPYICLKSVQKK